jgi:hypothetical protein
MILHSQNYCPQKTEATPRDDSATIRVLEKEYPITANEQDASHCNFLVDMAFMRELAHSFIK